MEVDVLVTGGVVVHEHGCERMDIGIKDGLVVSLTKVGHSPSVAARVIDAAGQYVFPGVIDPHTHIGLGHPEDWKTETQAAVRGGVTTVINYVMGSSPYKSQLPEEHAAAARLACVDYALHVVPCTQEHLDEIEECIEEHGITSFKFFTSFRGTEGAYLGIEGTDDGYLYEYMRRVGLYDGAVANIHPENIEVIWRVKPEVERSELLGLEAWNAARPDCAEAEAIYRAAFYAALHRTPLYIVHLSCAAGLEQIEIARQNLEGLSLYTETCPHYLTHTQDSPVGSLGKVNPPLRTEADVEALWEGLKSGAIDTVGSDHVARLKTFKDKGIWEASAGIPGVGTILTVLLSEGVHRRHLPLERVAAVTSSNSARIFGLYPKKGNIQIGADADLCVVDLDEERVVQADTWGGNAGFNLYEGRTMRGWPKLTLSRGEIVFDGESVVAAPGRGEYLPRKSHRKPHTVKDKRNGAHATS